MSKDKKVIQLDKIFVVIRGRICGRSKIYGRATIKKHYTQKCKVEDKKIKLNTYVSTMRIAYFLF
jgi:hypothetical protein